jgi:predicted alpha/beta superfamily hydrolase
MTAMGCVYAGLRLQSHNGNSGSGGLQMRLIHLTPLLLLAAFGCSSEKEAVTTDVWEPFAGALAYTQRRNLTSAITGRTYQISVALPENYATSNETYPVLYAVDANIQFGTVVETAREQHQFGIIPELIIVGIGYPVDRYAESQELRVGDICGRGDRDGFLEFIRQELIPLVELEFRANPAGRALYGHSCGGLFALHALFEGDGTFESFIAGSPATRRVRPLESTYAESHNSLRAQLFVSSGLLLDEPFPENPTDIMEFVTILESRNYSGLQIKSAYFEDENHITVIPATISRGLRAIYEGFPSVRSE